MAKNVVIGESESGLYIEISRGEFRKRSNRTSFIREYIDKNGKQFIDAKKMGEDLVLYTASGITIVLKNYENLKENTLLGTLIRRIETAPIVAENMSQKVRSNDIERLALKILYMNKIKLAALALAGTSIMIGGSKLFEVQSLQIDTQPSIAHFAPMSEKSRLDELVDLENGIQFEDSNNKSENIDLSIRLVKTAQLQTNYDGYDRSKIMLGARVNSDKMEAICQSDMGKIIIQTAETYGVDPYLLIAKGLAESGLEHDACCPNGNRYNGYGVGAFQLESPDGRMVKAWNYKTGREDTLSVTMENATDFEKNTQAAAMYLQNRIDFYHGNIYLALQSYNYGQGMMKLIIHDYAKQKGITEEAVKNNLNDLGWLEIVEDVHQNPNRYYYRVMLDEKESDPWIIKQAQDKYIWNEKTYGNSHYIADVLSYYIGTKTQNKNLDGTSTVLDLSSNEVMQVSNDISNAKVF